LKHIKKIIHKSTFLSHLAWEANET
jgi:hypothetical protein